MHNGRVIKRTGDGLLVEFRSVVDAVRCAIEVQNAMIERNAGVPAERRIEFRIGIHLGDVVEESDGDLMGDGVNIAVRLEGLAAPGAICLSEDAYRQVKARLDLRVSDLGPTQLKNIADPLRVYSLQVSKPAEAKPATPVETKADEKVLAFPASSDKPSIAVLPFQNMSGDPEQEFFADGLVEDIITTLSKASRLSHAIPASLTKAARSTFETSANNSACVICSKEAFGEAATGSESPRSSSTRIPGRTSGPSATTGRLTTSSPSRTRSRWSSRPKCR